MHDPEKVLTHLLLMLHLLDSTLSESSLNKTSKPHWFFTYLVHSTQYSQNIVLYEDLEKVLTSLLLMLYL